MTLRLPPTRALVHTATALLGASLMAVAFAQTAPIAPQFKHQAFSIPLLPPEQMTATDRSALQDQQEAVARSAQFYGYKVDASYTYREIACPLAPNHLLLAYESAAANGSISRFTAVILRSAGEEVAGRQHPAQIIPILHFGVTTFVPAIANSHSIEVFNAAISPAPNAVGVLSQIRDGGDPLLVRSLCYLAMVGEEPAALHPPPLLDASTIHAPVPTLQFQNHGKTRQLISIRNAARTYQLWALTYTPDGKLLSATREEHPIDTTAPMLNAANTSPSPVSVAATSPVTSNRAPRSQPPAAPSASVASSSIASPSIPPATTAAMPAPAPPASTASSAGSAPVSSEAAPAPVVPAIIAAASAEPANVAPPMPSRPPLQPPVSAPAASPSAASPSVVATTPEPSLPLSPASQQAAPSSPAPTTPVAASRLVPQPPGRYIASPPPPPVRFIPNSALQTPPHLPQ